jgi:hypothetical protein
LQIICTGKGTDRGEGKGKSERSQKISEKEYREEECVEIAGRMIEMVGVRREE